MPTYEYSCTECGEHLEVVQSFRDDPLTECPHCHGLLRKVFTPVGIVLKGSGFYKTDNRANGSKFKTPSTSELPKPDSSSSSDKSEKSGSSEKSSSGSDSKSVPAAAS
jgi:putative FmdB family regulatory protein